MRLYLVCCQIAALFARAVTGVNVKDLLTKIGSAAAAAPAAAPAAAAASAPAAKKEEKKEEKKKEESEEEEDADMGFGGFLCKFLTTLLDAFYFGLHFIIVQNVFCLLFSKKIKL